MSCYDLRRGYRTGSSDLHADPQTRRVCTRAYPTSLNSRPYPEYRIFLQSRRAEFVSKGTNVWSNIHVQDLVQAFLVILDHALQVQTAEDKRPSDGFDNFYFATAAEDAWGPVIGEVARAMHKRGVFFLLFDLRLMLSTRGDLGLIDSPEAQSVSVEKDSILSLYVGANSRAYSTRLKALGWVPKEKSIIDSVDGDVDFSAKMFTGKTEW
jgi:hypothetical protein